jgi:hypothetical protein
LGEGVAYHDSDTDNPGSGELNPLDGSYLHAFPVHEAVDISYAKVAWPTPLDDNRFKLVAPPAEQLYAGGTRPGEWLNYTVKTAETGPYGIDFLYMCSKEDRLDSK